ncbi:S1 family peptidase [Pseudocolwellia sp. HL-MZ19]|uniref:S1 family peptidase n=1 Tax=Pseudocolwellia sp. HL-MZ19 TaxID=3400846 RepID=UPI003CEB2417
MNKAYLFILKLVLLLSISLPAYAEKEELLSSQIKTLKKGIFEVVTLKLEDNTIYKDEFPKDLIPFHIRKDKQHSVGTAFLIDENTLVSAAHVFNIGNYSLFAENYAVRDSKGNLFKIKQVEKFSNYRDLIQFSIEGYTSKYHKFEFSDDYEEGDVVYAAGNALGEGVIFRKGSLTSFTYEAIDGQWKNIRYSAAASPGNSGGPLLNLAGEVVGIVTKKSSNENLNYALPIQEFIKFSDKEAEFYITQMAEVESLQRHRYTWKFNTKLPQNIMDLRAAAEESFYTRFANARGEFTAKFDNEIFPKHKNVDKYLKNQPNDNMLSIIDINGNGEWLLYSPENEREVSITKNQSLSYGSNNKMLGNYQFILEKPEDTKLASFIKDKKTILDTFLSSVQWNRKIAGTPVYIASYGEPVFEELHTDKYGRVWQTAAWNDQYSDQAIMIYCLPIPKGVACDLLQTSVAWLEVQKQAYPDNLHRIMLSYSGKLSEWREFLKLPDKFLPKNFHDSSVEINKNNVEFELASFSGDLEKLKLTNDSNLYVAMEVTPENTNELAVGTLDFSPNINEDGVFYISKYYDLADEASDSYKDFWQKFTQLETPYNFELLNEGKKISKYMNLGANFKDKKLIKNKAKGVSYLVGCQLQSEVKEVEFNESCDAFIKGIH